MHTPSYRFLARTRLLSAGLLLHGSAFAGLTTLLSDDFTDVALHGSGAEQYVTSSGHSYRQLVSWNLFAGTVDNGGALAFTAQANSLGYVRFPAVTLSVPGDYLTLTFKITYPAGAGDQNSALRYGLYQTGENIAVARNFDPENNPLGDTARGYYVTTNPGGVGPAWTPGGVSPNKDLANQVAALGNAVNGGAAGSTKGLGSFPRTRVFGSATQTVSLTITKTDSGVRISGSVAGDLFGQPDNSAPYTSFDTFFFSNGGSAGAWTMENLSIVTTVAR